jgi:hypothetical protein
VSISPQDYILLDGALRWIVLTLSIHDGVRKVAALPWKREGIVVQVGYEYRVVNRRVHVDECVVIYALWLVGIVETIVVILIDFVGDNCAVEEGVSYLEAGDDVLAQRSAAYVPSHLFGQERSVYIG